MSAEIEAQLGDVIVVICNFESVPQGKEHNWEGTTKFKIGQEFTLGGIVVQKVNNRYRENFPTHFVQIAYESQTYVVRASYFVTKNNWMKIQDQVEMERMRRSIEKIKHVFLEECKQDYVGLWSLVREVEDTLGTIAEPYVRKVTMDILRDLIKDRRIISGKFTEDEKFIYDYSIFTNVIEKIDTSWKKGTRPTMAGEIWFTIHHNLTKNNE